MSSPNPIFPSPADLENELSQSLPGMRSVRWLAETTSTNADLLEMARTTTTTLARPWLEGAHLQTAGRGRSGRTWHNREGANLMFSCAFDIFVAPRFLPVLSPLAGVVAVEALRRHISPAHQHRLSMKWPNDVLWDQAKLAGILAEITRSGTSRQSPDHHVLIIGIGLNLNDARSLSQSLNRAIADWREVGLADEQAADVTPGQLVKSIVSAWQQVFNEVTRNGFDDFPARYQAVDGLIGRHVNVIHDGRLVGSGIAQGVNETGQLRVLGPDGENTLAVGEISIRLRA